MLAVSLVAMLVFSAVPALADDGDNSWDDRWDDRQGESFFDGFFFFDGFDRFDDDEDFDRFDFDGGLNQDVEQDAESGDLDQSADVSQSGDNSNQCVGSQLVGNTGNVQNAIGVSDLGGNFNDDDNGDRVDDGFFFGDRFDNGDDNGDFEFDEVNSSIEVSPENTTSCDQEVNQAATASGW